MSDPTLSLIAITVTAMVYIIFGQIPKRIRLTVSAISGACSFFIAYVVMLSDFYPDVSPGMVRYVFEDIFVAMTVLLFLSAFLFIAKVLIASQEDS